MYTASHLSSDSSKLSTAAQTAAGRRKRSAEELSCLLLHYRYIFGCVRQRWIRSVNITFPHVSSTALAAHGDLNREIWCHPSLLQAQLKPVWKGCCGCPLSTWGQASRSHCQFGLITKRLPLLPTEKAVPLSDTGALAQVALQTNFGWWQERWLKASWQRRAVSISVLGESPENATEANSNR